MRQPAVTGVALTIFSRGAALAIASLNTKRTVSSMPSVPVDRFQVLESLREQLVGVLVFLPGAHVGILAFRRIRELFARPAFFKCRADTQARAPWPAAPGQTGVRLPTTALRQSSSSEVPSARRIASRWLAAMSCRAFSWRAARSSTVIGLARSFMDFRLAIDGGKAERTRLSAQ